MSQALANVNISTDTFNDLITKVNVIANTVSTVVVTANSTQGNTTGNAYLQGNLQADVVIAGTGLRGGNVGTSNTLTILSPISFNGLAGFAAGNVAYVANTPGQVLDTFSASSIRSAKYILQVNTSVGYQATEILLLQDGTNVTMTEYATITSNGTQATFSANLAAGTVTLYANPFPAVSTVTFKRSHLSI